MPQFSSGGVSLQKEYENKPCWTLKVDDSSTGEVRLWDFEMKDLFDVLKQWQESLTKE